MASAAKTQDLPPPGGYQKIIYQRVPPKSYFSGAGMIVGYLGITAAASYLFWLTCKHIHYDELENRSACLAIYPLLVAERDRAFLKQCRKNRDEEAKLMANVEGWKVGTWYGEKIYNTLPEDTFVTPRLHEYYAHTSNKEFARRINLDMWT